MRVDVGEGYIDEVGMSLGEEGQRRLVCCFANCGEISK